ncbi:metal-sensing transcriptional repressor [Candidatus Amesbacteria bacterium]|nr:metal-sensing transcriptional repressor [Candidatus Amesbacteria bacterium]
MKYQRNGVLHRLKIARGHLDKVIRMVQDDEYCIDILTQSQAVQGQLSEVDAKILEKHLSTCVADAMKKGENRRRGHG